MPKSTGRDLSARRPAPPLFTTDPWNCLTTAVLRGVYTLAETRDGRAAALDILKILRAFRPR